MDDLVKVARGAVIVFDVFAVMSVVLIGLAAGIVGVDALPFADVGTLVGVLLAAFALSMPLLGFLSDA